MLNRRTPEKKINTPTPPQSDNRFVRPIINVEKYRPILSQAVQVVKKDCFSVVAFPSQLIHLAYIHQR